MSAHLHLLFLRLDGNLQKLQVMWQNMFVDMKSLLSWQYLMRDIQVIRSWNVAMVITTKKTVTIITKTVIFFLKKYYVRVTLVDVFILFIFIKRLLCIPLGVPESEKSQCG